MQITKENWEETALAAIQRNPVLADLFMKNAKVGSENLGQSLPLLKIQSAGKSQDNMLANGKEATDGFYYYKPTKEEFETVTCHILTISRGFRADGLNNKKNVFNQILAGVIVNEGKFAPFMMYFTGTKLQSLWNFGKDASIYTKAKPIPVPIFALTVNMSSEKVKNNFGSSWIPKFEIVKENDFPVVIQDEKLFMKLRDHVSMVEDSIEALIDAKMTDEDVTPSASIPSDADFQI